MRNRPGFLRGGEGGLLLARAPTRHVECCSVVVYLAVAQIVILPIVWAQHVLMPLLLLLVLLLHYG